MKKVLTLASDAKTEGKDMVMAFLREQADLIASGDYVAEAAVIVFYEKHGDGLFKTGTRRCNLDLLEQIGLLQCSLIDVSRSDH